MPARDIDDALEAGGEIIQVAACSELAEGARASEAEALEVMNWVNATNAIDDAIGELAQIADYLAETHGRLHAAKVLHEVLGVHRAVHALLRGARQRLAQIRDLLRNRLGAAGPRLPSARRPRKVRGGGTRRRGSRSAAR